MIEPFSAVGAQPTTGFADDPVNTSTGNFLEPEHDLVFSDAAASLRFSRMYNSLDDRTGVFGFGWSSVLDIRLELDDDGAAFIMEDGRQIRFPRSGAGWGRGVGENYWLSDGLPERLTFVAGLPEHVLTVTDNKGNWWAFTPAGGWVAAGKGPGTTVRVLRDESGRITRLTHDRGRFIEVEYAADRVASVSASDGRRVEYLYDDYHRLTEVTTPTGARTYRWNEAGLIDHVVGADGVVEVVNTYDAQGRVTRQLTPYGRSVRFAYLRGRVTSVSTDDGTGANTWIADRQGRVVGIIDAEGHRQSMAYDPHGNIVMATGRDDQVTVHAYDDRGRKIRTVTPEGADITYGYDNHDRVTTVVTASGGVVEYQYSSVTDRNPSKIVDPVGGRTKLTWVQGLLTRVVDPEGVTVSLDYNDFGELIGVTNAHGDTTRYLRDTAGQITKEITPLGAETSYQYDSCGLLVARQDPTGAMWRYHYGAGGRLSAIIDPDGHRTEAEYGPHGQISTITDPLGRVTQQEYDAFGNLAVLTLPNGDRWAYTHDGLSRLREVTDPTGAVWAYQYDVTGQLSATIDPTGVRTDITDSPAERVQTIRNAFEKLSLHTDEYGRLVKTQSGDETAQLISYDAGGRPVELVDANGGLTSVEYDLAGRITGITTPAQRTTRYEYDACGRPSVAIDPTGARTTLSYDADSRVIGWQGPTGETGAFEYDPAGRVLKETIPGVGVARYRYDKLGRLISIGDSRYGARKFRYDAAGQLTQAINGLGGVTQFEYDMLGRVAKVTDPGGGVTTYDHTPLGDVRSVSDPLNRTIKTTYDAAGRKKTQTDADGHITEFRYDAAGRVVGMFVNGHMVSQVVDNTAQRTTTIDDGTYREPVEHRLSYNRLGQLVSRVTTRGEVSEETRWDYDADGYRTGMVSPDGTRVDYHCDQAGRISRIDHGVLGEVVYDYDAQGRIVQARTGDQVQTWGYVNGFPVTHTCTEGSGDAAVTRMVRDEAGRITSIIDPAGTTTTYAYDQAHQLIRAESVGKTTTWDYDVAGRLTAESTPAGSRSYVYDQAGQLVQSMGPDGGVTRYEYDGQGQRIREHSDQVDTSYTWDGRGRLQSIEEKTAGGTTTTGVWVNGLGELAQVNDTRLQWDLAAGVPRLLEAGGTSVFTGPGGVTGINTSWQQPLWRGARGSDPQDPWQSLATVFGRAEVGIGVDGSLHVAGLEWMGARVYDPGSVSFLSQDPLLGPLGAVWAANPYAYAGNDPLHAVDPHGLAPITDEELRAYADGLQGPLATGLNTAVDWAKDNWDVLAIGAVGVALMATGVASPLVVALIGAGISGGVSAYSQHKDTGEIDWSVVAVDAAIGTIGGGAGAGAAKMLTGGARRIAGRESRSRFAQTSQKVLDSSTARSAVSSGIDGGTSNTLAYQFHQPDGQHTPSQYLQAFGSGFATSSLGSAGTRGLRPKVGEQMTKSLPHNISRTGNQLPLGEVVGEQLVDRTVGGIEGAVNELLRPEIKGQDRHPLIYGVEGAIAGGHGTSAPKH